MSDKEPRNPEFVKTSTCTVRHEKTDLALFGKDGRGGIVKDIADIKNYMETHRASERNWRSFIYPIGVGLILFGIGYLANHVGAL